MGQLFVQTNPWLFMVAPSDHAARAQAHLTPKDERFFEHLRGYMKEQVAVIAQQQKQLQEQKREREREQSERRGTAGSNRSRSQPEVRDRPTSCICHVARACSVLTSRCCCHSQKKNRFALPKPRLRLHALKQKRVGRPTSNRCLQTLHSV